MKKSVKAYREKLLRRRGKIEVSMQFESIEKDDKEAEQRKTKVVEPDKNKIKRPVFPEDRMDYTLPKKKRGRPKKK